MKEIIIDGQKYVCEVTTNEVAKSKLWFASLIGAIMIAILVIIAMVVISYKMRKAEEEKYNKPYR